MAPERSRTSLAVVVATAAVALAVAAGVAFGTRPRSAPLAPGEPRPAPIFGVDLIYYSSPPFVLIDAFGDPERGTAFGDALRSAGLRDVRFSSHGIYSHLGPRAMADVQRQTKLPNRIPWFPVENFIRTLVDQDLRAVVGINPEEGPAAAVDMVERFRRAGALDRIVAVELGNEPHLNARPWRPEEYGEAAAAIVRALEPYRVRFALPLTIGKETKTPTKLSDDDYTRRELAAFDALVPLANRDDVYGVIHLYARGVDPRTLDALDALVRPVAPRMRYLVTEFNIRSTLAANQQLTTPYAVEFMKRTGRLVADSRVAGLYVHGIPYHSLFYWNDGRGVATVSKLSDPRLTGEDLTAGWHLTPVGQITSLFARELWRGEILAFDDEGDVQRWIVRTPTGELRAGLLNSSDSRVRRDFDLGGRVTSIDLGPRSAAVVSSAGEVGRVALTRGW